MTLSSIITVSGRVNISIIGHHNPIINCSNGGGLKFTSCHNCTIEGITWDGCGAENINGSVIPAIEFYNSANITIQNCTFQHSVGQAVVLSKVSGNVRINHCGFLHNMHYKGHGTAVYFSPSNNFQEYTEIFFTINRSHFSKNKGTHSIIYIAECGKNSQSLLINSCVFSGNKGTSLYLSNQNLHLDNILFDNNKAEHGVGIVVSDHSTIIFSKNSVVTFNQNTANNSGGAIFLNHFSSAIFEANCFVMFNNNTANHYGGSIFSDNNSNVLLKGNASVQFNNNVAKFGGAVYINTMSAFVTVENSSLIFNGNKADLGGAVYLTCNSVILFKKIIPFYYSTTNVTGLLHNIYNVTKDSVMITFINNSALQGGAIYVGSDSLLQFKENTLVVFMYNKADSKGGAISCHENSNILFEEKMHIIFANNKAQLGGGVSLEDNAAVILKGNTNIQFIYNEATENGGAVFLVNSKEIYQENSTVRYINNTAKSNGGGVCFSKNSNVNLDKYSTCTVTFYNNEATQGGAVYSEGNTNITIGGQSTIMFNNNNAMFGGAVYCYNNTIITTNGNSLITFANNTALEQGGALVIKHNSDLKLKKNSTVVFDSNKVVHNGGSVFLEIKSCIYFDEHCRVTFDGNTADDGTGGAISINVNSVVAFNDNSVVKFYNNSATQGGALNLYSYSYIVFQGGVKSTVIFDNNKVTQNGGAVYLQKNSAITFRGTHRVKFHYNEGTLGGAINCNSNSHIIFDGHLLITFSRNTAKLGGAIYTVMANITIGDNSKLTFTDNIALQDGGALFLDRQFSVIFTDDAKITFSFNTATDYGGAIYSRVDQSVINFNITDIHFDNNHARTAGSSVFINVPTLCNSSCLNNSVLGARDGNLQGNELSKYITTSPRKMKLYKPAECIDNNSVGCDSYYIENIMLGQEILIDACMYDYYDRPTGTEEFLVSSADGQDYYILGSQYILISCNHTFQGITIVGNKIIPVLPFNYSLTIGLYVVRTSEMKTISVSLTVQLSTCHPGFWYDNTSQKCECYNSTSIVSCSGSSSSIRKGHWFGSVAGRPTVTFCPIGYCNFTCCETVNGYYHLSPVRGDQCMSHRSGTACSNCEVGYSLSFDSTECIHLKACKIGQTILLVILIILYWIAITVAVFVMMYFKVEIGYLYGITYYYSIVDVLLNQNLLLSSEKLNTLINVMSSITKITPQFLGHLCLMKGMSGIDQQFVHYMHPLAVSLIVVSISYLARKLRRLLFFIRRGIISFICFLLLLSYTSVATTSLLLMRPLKFHNVDKTYTYLSPEIEYFHGRHLVYSIVSVLLTIVIVIGLPFLLLFEPFLSRKINFIKIKPLLDQFKGCYKDKYRCFAAYYMICRLVIIIIIIVNSPNVFTARYLLITACVIMALLHQIWRPYTDYHLNFFDGVILHLTILVSVLPLAEYFDNDDLSLLTGTIYILVLSPLIGLITMTIWIHRNNVKMMIVCCSSFKCNHSRITDEIPLNDCEVQLLKEVIVDDDMRRNATVASRYVSCN